MIQFNGSARLRRTLSAFHRRAGQVVRNNKSKTASAYYSNAMRCAARHETIATAPGGDKGANLIRIAERVSPRFLFSFELVTSRLRDRPRVRRSFYGRARRTKMTATPAGAAAAGAGNPSQREKESASKQARVGNEPICQLALKGFGQTRPGRALISQLQMRERQKPRRAVPPTLWRYFVRMCMQMCSNRSDFLCPDNRRTDASAKDRTQIHRTGRRVSAQDQRLCELRYVSAHRSGDGHRDPANGLIWPIQMPVIDVLCP